MSESIEIKLKCAAITLAEELSYSLAAAKLNITSAELEKQISTLEEQLCLQIFLPRQKQVELTAEGEFLIRAFRELVALHDGRGSDGIQKQENEKEPL